MWFRHPTFEILISDIWTNGQQDLRQCFLLLPGHLRVWNQQVFGNIFYKKARCVARLDGIQRGLCVKNSPFLEDFEGKVTAELNEILIREHLYWKQKAGIRWLQGGE